jgi:hypothetical protein
MGQLSVASSLAHLSGPAKSQAGSPCRNRGLPLAAWPWRAGGGLAELACWWWGQWGKGLGHYGAVWDQFWGASGTGTHREGLSTTAATRVKGIDSGGSDKWSMAPARGSERCATSVGSSWRWDHCSRGRWSGMTLRRSSSAQWLGSRMTHTRGRDWGHSSVVAGSGVARQEAMEWRSRARQWRPLHVQSCREEGIRWEASRCWSDGWRSRAWHNAVRRGPLEAHDECALVPPCGPSACLNFQLIFH